MIVKGKKVMPGDASRVNRATRMPVPILGLVGVGISAYLTYVHYAKVKAICLPQANCDAVLASPYAQMWGVPLSLIGALMYAFLSALGFLFLRQRNEGEGLIALGTYAIALSGTLYSAYLFYLELFEIHAFCTWCLASALVIVCILVLSLVNLSSAGLISREKSHRARFRLSRYVQW